MLFIKIILNFFQDTLCLIIKKYNQFPPVSLIQPQPYYTKKSP